MEPKELLIKSAKELVLQGELPQKFLEKDLPIDLLQKLLVAIYLDINIMLPGKMEDNERQTLLLMAVLFTMKPKLVETDVPNVYRMYIKEPDHEVYALDEVTEVKKFIFDKLSLFLKIYHEDKENNALEKFQDFLEWQVKSWNNFGVLPEERVFKLSRIKPFPEIASETGFNEEKIRELLEDYETRKDSKKLSNLKRFEQKVLDHISKLPAEKQYIIDYYRFLLNKITTGGIDIEKPEDLFPKQFPLVNKPNSLSYN